MFIDLVKTYTKSSNERLEAMAGAIRIIDENGIEGDIVECGVWRGGNIILSRKMSPGRVCWLYDTFTGMTEPEDVDAKSNGKKASESYHKKMRSGGKWAGVSVEDVKSNLKETGTFDEGLLKFVVGPVEKTLLVDSNLPDKIAILRLDTDWYRSTKIELEALFPRLSVGGVLIIDDFGHWMGARKAVDDYFVDASFVWTEIDYTAVMMVKS